MPKRPVVPSLALAVFFSVFHLAGSRVGMPAMNGTSLSRAVAVQSVSLVINEFLADPPDGAPGDSNGDGTRDSADDEFVELVNTGSTPLNVGGFTISDSSQVRFTIPSGTSIPAGEAAIIFGGGTPTGSFGSATANSLVFAIGGAGLSLNNGGDSIIIKSNIGAIVVSVSFGSAEGGANQSITRSPDITGSFTLHSTAPGSGGRRFSPGTRVNGSLFVSDDPVITSLSPDFAIAGQGAVTVSLAGTRFRPDSSVRVDGAALRTVFVDQTRLEAEVPGSLTGRARVLAIDVENADGAASNAVSFVVLGAAGINEFLADPPDGPIGDANGDGNRDSSDDEFVEIINRTNEPLHIGGFSVSDGSQLRFIFPTGTLIPAEETAVIFGGGRPQGEFGNAGPNGLVFTAPLSLNNGGDTITLKDPSGIVVESISFGPGEGNANQSFNRNPETFGTSFAPHASFAESGGRLFSPGSTVAGVPFTSGPRITRVVPDSIVGRDSPFDLLIHGTGFDTGTVVLLDFIPVQSSVINGNQITAVVPESVAGSPGEHQVAVLNLDGNRSNVLKLVIISPPPAITLFTPRFVEVGSADFTLRVFGKHFDSGAEVVIDGSSLTTTKAGAGELRAMVPASAALSAGIRSVRVRNGDGQLSTEAALTVVSAQPRVTSLLPSRLVAGSPAFTLEVHGSNFKDGAGVRFGNDLLAAVVLSSSRLIVEIPGSLIERPGVRAVVVENPDGVTSDETSFHVIPVSPVIRSIEPASLTEGAGEVLIAFAGEKFQSGAIVQLIEDAKPATRLDTRFVSAERLEAVIPSQFTANAARLSLRIENPDLGFSNAISLDVLIRDPIVINEFLADPPDGSPGDANGDGSRSANQDEFIELVNRTPEGLDLSGYALADSESVRHVFKAGVVIPPFEAVVVFGGGAPRGAFGNASENNLVFTASSGGLSLGNGGDAIRLLDSSGNLVQEIRFGSREAGANESLNRDPDGSGAAFQPHSRVVPGSHLLFSPGATAAGQSFTVKPRIDSLTPNSVRKGSDGFDLRVIGARFQPGAAVLFGGTRLEPIAASDIELEARVLSNLLTEGGTIEVRVRNPKGVLSNVVRLVVTDDPPKITSLSPARIGSGAEGMEIRITGERLQSRAKVIISGVQMDTVIQDSTNALAVLPAALARRAAALEVHIRNDDGNISNSVTLAIDNGPLITRVSRSRIRAGAGEIDLTLTGIGFKPGIILLVNGAVASSEFISESRLNVRLGSEFTDAPATLEMQAKNTDGGRSNKIVLRIVE